MAGQVVQAIIVPENGNLELLKEIFGNDFDKIRTDMAEKDGDGTSVIYYQAQKSTIPKLGTPVAVGSSGVKVCAGQLSQDVGPTETVATFSLPVIEVAETPAQHESANYGLSDLATRFLGELKKLERRLLDEVKGLVAEKKVKDAEVEIEIETQSDEGKSAITGGEPMSEKEFVTKEDLQAALQPLAEKAEAMTEGLESIKGIAEAVKGIQEKLNTEPEGKTPETNADVNADPTKAASVDAAEVLKGFTDKIAILETDLTAAKSALEDQVGKINALQHAGGQHVEVEDAVKKAANDPKSASLINQHFAAVGWAN